MTLLYCLIFANIFIFDMSGKSKKGSSVSGNSPENVTSFDNPDFAFPRDVIKEASKVFEESMRSGDGERALKAAMQMDVADMRISHDSIGATIKRYQEVADKFGAPWSNIACLLEAKALNKEYSSDRWDYNQRVLPINELDGNPQLWSGDQFQNEISKLCEASLQDYDALCAMNLTKIAGLLKDLRADNPCGYTVADFIVFQVLDLYSDAGLGSSKYTSESLQPMKLIDQLISADESRLTAEEKAVGGTPALMRAQLRKVDLTDREHNESDKRLISGYPAELLEKYPGRSALRGYLIATLYDRGLFNLSDLAARRELYKIVKSSLPVEKPKILSKLKSILNELTRPEYRLSTSGQWLPKGGKIDVEAKNITDGRLLLVPISISQAESSGLRNKNLKATGPIREIAHFEGEKGMPSEDKVCVDVDNMQLGYYAIVMSKTGDLTGIYEMELNDTPEIILVSNLSCFATNEAGFENKSASKGIMADKYLYVVDGENNKPVAGATVAVSNDEYNKRHEKIILTTDSEGKIELPFTQNKAVITYGDSRLLWNVSKNYSPSTPREKESASIFTDLAIYHPGDSLQFAVVVNKSNGKRVSIVENAEVKIELLDANYQKVAEQEIKCDAYGRGTSAFKLPEEGLTGRFQLRALKDKQFIGSRWVDVSEYKSPTFRVILDAPEISDPDAAIGNEKKITLSGTVMTYSGMPLSGSEVNIKIDYNPWWGWWRMSAPSQSEFGSTVTTDSDGRFKTEIVIPQGSDNDYDFGVFRATAIATNVAGETQQSDAQTFALGEGYKLEYTGNSEIEVKAEYTELPVKVTDMMGKPVKKELNYTLCRLDYKGEKEVATVAEGTFTSPDLKILSSNIPSGTYILRVVLPKGIKMVKDGVERWEPDTLERDLTIWRADDKNPPRAMELWVPQKIYYAQPGDKEVEVTVGSGFDDEWIFMQVADGSGVKREEWLRPRGRNLKIKVNAPEAGERININFVGCHELNQVKNSITIYPAQANRKTEFRIDTFRDKLMPGDQERWRFRLMSGWPRVKDGEPAGMECLGDAAVMAVMSNEALDAIVPFIWSYTPQSLIEYTALGGVQIPWKRNISAYNYLAPSEKYHSYDIFETPMFLYASGYGREYTLMRSYSMASKNAHYLAEASDDMDGAPLPTAVTECAKMDDSVVEEEFEVASAAGSDAVGESEIELRDVEMPLAFFRPLLSTDSEGYVEVEFTVPNFNTTWAFQILGYDKEGNANVTRLTAQASKPIMVSTVMPRFLLTGDKAQISATLFNALEESQVLKGKIEIFDPISGTVLAQQSEEFELSGNSSRVISVDVDVPEDVNQLGIRAIAESEKGSDGEQGVVPVFPSSTPVMDSTTFYLTPGEKEFELELPKMKGAGNVTLNYCDNPYWYVLTSLSGKLYPESESSIEQAVALYSLSVATGMLEKNPKLKEGLKLALEDEAARSSLLLSPLAKNQSLKISALNCTPWVNNETSETMRMQGLGYLYESADADKAISDAIEKLDKMRNAGGSWSWVKGMPESLWATEQVLTVLGKIKMSDYMPSSKTLKDKIERMIREGIKFTDAEESKIFREIVYKDKGRYSLESEIYYLNLRSNAVDDAPQGLIAEMKRDMLSRLPKEWKTLSIRYKSLAAILLNREGERTLAKTILESVKQYASYKADKGMWFDNQESGFFAASPILLASECLDAYMEVDPENTAVEGLAQYLVLSRQTTDWNNELGQAGVALVANSIVMAIKDKWISDADKSESGSEVKILLNGKELPMPSKSELLTGNFYIDLNAKEASGAKLRIMRAGESPAWGGVMNQYIAPIEDVKAHSVGQLRIVKALLPIVTDSLGTSASASTKRFHKGERVRVTLTISTDRDLDYVLISDQLGAWMQPSDQLTRYDIQNGLWVLQETRRSKVNFYISRLPKGNYVMSYEVNADRDGEYSTGMAVAQSQYYPMITSHSAGMIVNVESRNDD